MTIFIVFSQIIGLFRVSGLSHYTRFLGCAQVVFVARIIAVCLRQNICMYINETCTIFEKFQSHVIINE